MNMNNNPNTWSWGQISTSNSTYGNFPINTSTSTGVTPGVHQESNANAMQFHMPLGQAQTTISQEVYPNPAVPDMTNALPMNVKVNVMPQIQTQAQAQPVTNPGSNEQYQQQPQGNIEYLTGAEAEAVLKKIPNFPYPYSYENGTQNMVYANQGGQDITPSLQAQIPQTFPEMSTSGAEVTQSQNGSGEGFTGNSDQLKVDGAGEVKAPTGASDSGAQQQLKTTENSGVGVGATAKKQGKGKPRTPKWMRQTQSQAQFFLPRLLPSYESPPYLRPVASVPSTVAPGSGYQFMQGQNQYHLQNQNQTQFQNQNQTQYPNQNQTQYQIQNQTQYQNQTQFQNQTRLNKQVKPAPKKTKPTFHLCGKCIKCKLLSGNTASLPPYYQKSTLTPFNLKAGAGTGVGYGSGAMGRQSSSLIFPNN